MILTPRPYQEECIQANVDFLSSGKPGNAIDIVPTAGGKALITAETIRRLGEPALVLQPNKEILVQNAERYRSYGLEASIYSASLNEKIVSDVTFATIGSIVKKPELFKHFKYLLLDECFPYNQLISTEAGRMKIGDIVANLDKGVVVPRVYSYNEKTRKMEMKNIVAGRCNGTRDCVEIKMGTNAKVKVTKNHPFLTLDGWKQAGHLQAGDCILTDRPVGRYLSIPNGDQYEMLLGSVVGDGCIRDKKIKNVNRVSFIHGEPQKDYIEWKANLLGCTVTKVEKNGYSGKPAYRFNSKKMFFPDEMREVSYAIDNLTPKSLAVIWMDDGSMAKLENAGALYAAATSSELTLQLQRKLLSWGIDTSFRKRQSSSSKKDYYCLLFNKENTYKISELVAPYVHPAISYKIHSDFKSIVGSYKWDDQFNTRGACVVVAVTSTQPEVVYNIQVEDNETYVITSQGGHRDVDPIVSGLIVHNCHLVSSKSGMYADFIKAIGETKVLGLTATPYRLSTSSFGSTLKFLTRTRPRIFSDVNYVIQTETLFSQGFLCPVEYFDMRPYLEFDRRRIRSNSTGAEFDETAMKAYMDAVSFTPFLIKTLTRLLEVRKRIVTFVRFTAQAHEVASYFGEEVQVVTAETPAKERDRMIADWRSGKIKMLVNVGILTVGVDVPELDTVVMARATKSLALYYQVAGRGLRIHPNKKTCYFVDLCDNLSYFGKIEDLHVGHDVKGLWEVTTVDPTSKTGRKPLTNCILT